MNHKWIFIVGFIIVVSSSIAAEISATNLKANTGANAPRIVHFPGGKATIERNGEREKILITDLEGKIQSESWCDEDTGHYDQLVSLFRQLQKAIKKGDRKEVTKLVRYPLRVNGTKRETIKNQEQLLQLYEKVFTNEVIQKIVTAEAAAVFCRNGQAMLGDGVIWAHIDNKQAGIDIVNR